MAGSGLRDLNGWVWPASGRLVVAREHAGGARREHQEGIKGILVPLRCLHAGRAERHGRDGETDCRRPLVQQTDYVRRRDVAFNEIAIDQSGVTRGQRIRKTSGDPDRSEIGKDIDRDNKSSLAHVRDPTIAARAGRRLVDDEVARLTRLGASRSARPDK